MEKKSCAVLITLIVKSTVVTARKNHQIVAKLDSQYD